ncbi:MAG: hypothetical protein JST76_13540 [Bacteroidetes bacterium]|nr:hypothetical protein [Bacteroidota bacterium]
MRYQPKKGGAATYQKRQLILNDLFQKKTELFWTNKQLKEYMIVRYGYTNNTAQKYCEYLWQMIRDEVKVDYEQDLAQTIEYMTHQIQEAEDSFTRLQWVKELNKIKGLQIKKVEVTGEINHIETIKLVSHKREPAAALAIEVKPELPVATIEPVVIPLTKPDENELNLEKLQKQ